MKAPVKELRETKALLDEAIAGISACDWGTVEEKLNRALELDDGNPRIYELMGKMFEARGDGKSAKIWQSKAEMLRKRAWEKQVEAEARGHHEVFGKPGRHEIP